MSPTGHRSRLPAHAGRTSPLSALPRPLLNRAAAGGNPASTVDHVADFYGAYTGVLARGPHGTSHRYGKDRGTGNAGWVAGYR